ncbi:Flp family type IVb pilin [Sphingopyxis sp. MWB1]|uniref:Flp family type IVb pilin n=1 Tax=Sphingopyxis sp. MWB1 TaxID=1537715 RepID=UPI0009DD35B4|nr:Flp family type IVb pilin [Sphingopyxis sp. MWB1]
MRRFWAKLARSTAGATAIEYALILTLIFLAAVAAMTNVGTSTSAMWTHVSTTLNGAVN